MGERSTDERSSSFRGKGIVIEPDDLSEEYPGFEAFGFFKVAATRGKAPVQAPKDLYSKWSSIHTVGDNHMPNGAFASEGGIDIPEEYYRGWKSVKGKLELRYEEQIPENISREFPGIEAFIHLYSKRSSIHFVGDNHMPNGAFASEGGTPLMTGIGVIEHGKPTGTDHHIINIPACAEKDTRDYKFPKGQLATLTAAMAAQTVLSQVGGPGAMNLWEPIFYSAAAANATAFVGSSLALLLLKKKPYASSILEMVGFASAIATFVLMTSAFIPWK